MTRRNRKKIPAKLNKTLESFEEYLNTQTKKQLAYRSKKLYVHAVWEYLEEYGSVNKKNLTGFIRAGTTIPKIGEKSQASRIKYRKAAMLHYLKFSGNKKLLTTIQDDVLVPHLPRKQRPLYPHDTIMRIIDSIVDDKYKDIAMLQYFTAARSKEILTLKEENVDAKYKKGVIKLVFVGKGNKNRTSVISEKVFKHIEPYLEARGGFLFLSRTLEAQDVAGVERAIKNSYTIYYKRLREAGEFLNIEKFGTHDLRRHAAERMRRKNTDAYLLSKLLGHSSMDTTKLYLPGLDVDMEKLLLEHQDI